MISKLKYGQPLALVLHFDGDFALLMFFMAGTTHVLKAGREFEVLGRNELGEQAWSSPAIADGALYIRTAQQLYCIVED